MAHISEDGERYESVAVHLNNVAAMAASFAESFGASGWAYVAGIAHDIGKYSNEFQDRILHDGPKVDHSTAGAIVLDSELNLRPLAYCVAGHHGGLPDAGTRVDDSTTLFGRLNKEKNGYLPQYSAYKNEIKIESPDHPTLLTASDYKSESEQSYSLQFLIRMIFSCLVDADFLCTEIFMNDAPRESLHYDELPVLCNRLENLLIKFRPSKTKLGSLRCNVSDDCFAAAKGSKGFYSLTAPTGSGKTYSLLRFALQHACFHGMSRVICAVPYTSIIEQNAQVYRDVLGSENVLEHHSGYDFDTDEFSDSGLGARLRLAAENWDAPVVVTTNVQLFESLYSNKTSRCRKLHNITNSVIVLDEAQMVPSKFLIPCVKALSELVKNYGCTVLLSSATQPALERFLEREGLDCSEIISDTENLFSNLRRVSYRSLGAITDEGLAVLLAQNNQVLCIVNNRKRARTLYDTVCANLDDESAIFYLSTLMCPEHRGRILKDIRVRLDSARPCILIATSLVEAGVDLDFPIVYREVAGVDSMVQAAGRCNREGARPSDESFVYLFKSSDRYRPPYEVRQRAAISELVLPGLNVAGGDISQTDALPVIEKFFNLLYDVKGNSDLDYYDIVKALSNCGSTFAFDFAQVSKKFNLIDDNALPVIIPSDEIAEEVRQLEQGFVFRSQMRRISRFSVNLYQQDIEKLRSEGAIHELIEGMYLLDDKRRYSEKTGFDITLESGEAFFW